MIYQWKFQTNCNMETLQTPGSTSIQSVDYDLTSRQMRITFKSGERYTNKELKQLLQDRYNQYCYVAVAKATNIKQFGFDFIRCKIKKAGKYINGVQLVKL